ncbi:MAG: chloride channel protein, partial [Streptosporangiaceae bacterium]
ALYAVVAMGAVFASAAGAPLTSLASVVEMTGDFALTLPVMLAVAIASAISRVLSYGTIYTTKLLRRGTDIDRTTPWRVLTDQGRRRHATVPAAAASYRLIEITVGSDSPGTGRKLKDVAWPQASIPLSVVRGRRLRPPHPDLVLAPGDHVSLLTSVPDGSPVRRTADRRRAQPATDGPASHA